MFLLCTALSALFCGSVFAAEEEPAAETGSTVEELSPDAEASEAEDEEPAPDTDVDYMQLMIRAAFSGDMEALEAANAARNEKIERLQLDCGTLTVEEFLANLTAYAGFSREINYLAVMKEACLTNDRETGIAAQATRNRMIDTLGLTETKISYDDLYLLAKVITGEAGSSWLSAEWKMSVGEVLLNRVASPEFPDTLYACVYQRGQYQCASSWKFENMKPEADCVDAAARLLSGERVLNDPSVVYQANFPQGKSIAKVLYDRYYGYTYLCRSVNQNLYV